MVATPPLVISLFKNLLWKVNTKEKEIYLTFDDGPTPEITDWVLGQLALYNAKATFFCIGKNIEMQPEIFSRVIKGGHSIGNHTNNHLNGWKTNVSNYLDNTEKAQENISKHLTYTPTPRWFRPPYGKITPSQAKELKKRNYHIVMWHVVSYDWDNTISPEICFENIKKNTKEGSIIVLHDSVKAYPNLREVLPRTLEFYTKKGYHFKGLDNRNNFK